MKLKSNSSAVLVTRKFLFGTREKSGALSLAFTYIMLSAIGFVFMYPVIYMIVHSFFSQADIVDPTVTWIPSTLHFDNFSKAFKTLDFGKSFTNSLIMSLGPAILQTASCAVIGFGFARFEFPLKKIWMVLIVTTFIIPSQVTLVPRYVLFYQYKILDTIFPSYLTAFLGQGIKSAVFILIYWQSFKSYPVSFDEAAQIDGAGAVKVFLKIAIPMVKAIILVTFLFSFIWYWNETTQANLYFGSKITTLPMKLQQFTANFEALFSGESGASISESITLAGTLVSILPVIVMYLIFQKQFVESIESTGIAGE